MSMNVSGGSGALEQYALLIIEDRKDRRTLAKAAKTQAVVGATIQGRMKEDAIDKQRLSRNAGVVLSVVDTGSQCASAGIGMHKAASESSGGDTAKVAGEGAGDTCDQTQESGSDGVLGEADASKGLTQMMGQARGVGFEFLGEEAAKDNKGSAEQRAEKRQAQNDATQLEAQSMADQRELAQIAELQRVRTEAHSIA